MNLLDITHADKNIGSVVAEVLLPLPLDTALSYAVPISLEDKIDVGSIVLVPLGRRKEYAGLVLSLSGVEKKPEHVVKPIKQIIYQGQWSTSGQLELWRWMTAYYMVNLGDVMQAALPTLLKISSETLYVALTDDLKAIEDDVNLDDADTEILHTLTIHGPLAQSMIVRHTGLANPLTSLKRLMKLRLVATKESLGQTYSPKRAIRYCLTKELSESPEAFDNALAQLHRAPKQKEAFLKLSVGQDDESLLSTDQEALLKTSDKAALNALAKRGWVEKYWVDLNRLEESYIARQPKAIELSSEQASALKSIQLIWQTNSTKAILLQGVTGSGKTMLYVELIKDCLRQGRQALFMLPEIALTSQMIQRIRQYFDCPIGVYHSRFSPAYRVELYQKVLCGEISIILGARSSVFLPYKNLGLVIVDEEHEASYKQQDPTPRYHGRDVALVLAKQQKASIILGSATPSLESLNNVMSGKWDKVEIKNRFNQLAIPTPRLIDLIDAKKRHRLKGRFSQALIEAIQGCLDRKEQVILYQNRRGYATLARCNTCESTAKCHQCDVSLTYHKYSGNLRCHYCGSTARLTSRCASCSSQQWELYGSGTQRIEEEIESLFPQARILRMDRDTAASRKRYENMLNGIEEYKYDILIGTQLIGKGLDFQRVTLVGVLDADEMLHFPTFRNNERCYNTLKQLAGRAGRGHKEGQVLVQSRQVDHPVLKALTENSWEAFIEHEQLVREQYNYPPTFQFIVFEFSHKDVQKTAAAARYFATGMKHRLGDDCVLGPSLPPVERVRNTYRREVILKTSRNSSSAKQWRNAVRELEDHRKAEHAIRSVRLKINVDAG